MFLILLLVLGALLLFRLRDNLLTCCRSCQTPNVTTSPDVELPEVNTIVSQECVTMMRDHVIFELGFMIN